MKKNILSGIFFFMVIAEVVLSAFLLYSREKEKYPGVNCIQAKRSQLDNISTCNASDSKNDMNAFSAGTFTNSIGMEFVLIPNGGFMMGSDAGPADEAPRHKVNISKSFYMGKFEVTQEQWNSLMCNNPSGYYGPDGPVASVSWENVQEFIRLLNRK